jgi:porphobilinogen deaminase
MFKIIKTMVFVFPQGAIIVTSSAADGIAGRPARLNIVRIRGNVPTRLQQVAGRNEFAATVLALAGLTRLKYLIHPDGKLVNQA